MKSSVFSGILDYSLAGHAVSEWGIALLWAAGAMAAAKIALRFNRKIMQKRALRTATPIDDILFKNIETPLTLALTLAGIWLGARALHLPPDADAQTAKACRLLLILDLAWFLSKMCRSLTAQYLANGENSASKNGKRIDPLIIHSIRQTINVLIWIVAALTSLQTLGINVRTLLATLGIGGMAVALAAQDTLKNIIGGITLLIDRPFKNGDRIRTEGADGFVEHIGLRSVSLRTIDNRSVTIPNKKMVDASIENVSREPSLRIVLTLGLPYSVTPDRMREALNILQSLPKKIHSIAHTAVASFSNYGDWALEITFVYYIKKKYAENFLEVKSEVNLAILNDFAEAGLEFAFPTQTLLVQPQIEPKV